MESSASLGRVLPKKRMKLLWHSTSTMDKLTRAALYKLCKANGIARCSAMNKKQLLAVLTERGVAATVPLPSFAITFVSTDGSCDDETVDVPTLARATEAIYVHLDEDHFEYTDSFDLAALAAFMRSALVGGERVPMRHFYDNAEQSLTYRGVLCVGAAHISRVCPGDATPEMYIERLA